MAAIGVVDSHMPLLSWRRAYGARDPDAIAAARDFAVEFLEHARRVLRAPLADRVFQDVQLVVSELVTNTAKYAPGPCAVSLALAPGGIDVTVCDSNPSVPRSAPQDPDRVGRHGLEIAAALSEYMFTWRHAAGKCVRARIALS
ncbi:ATP-binding protein [Streptantibioticus rubrisoli]|uniref:ATP-binding protein n=1 Tax=Streptantibioticus rubrisoli TaxID=1387313 RepID=A0ABT1P6T5_9ACTN|nr:ATP-binding protein [Streptantibioticus rubrisoli]MCQ4041091.1 ATP-binding protein [Streptantibioticus rubrisoli]